MHNYYVHKIAKDLSHTINNFIGKGFTFSWDSYVHTSEQFDRGEVM